MGFCVKMAGGLHHSRCNLIGKSGVKEKPSSARRLGVRAVALYHTFKKYILENSEYRIVNNIKEKPPFKTWHASYAFST